MAVRFALVAMGFTWVGAQVVLLRELLVTFHGNELVLGVALAIWLLAGAAGSAVSGRWVDRLTEPASGFTIASAALATALPTGIVLARCASSVGGLIPGEAASLWLSAAGSAASLAPVSALCGALFVVACRLAPGDGPPGGRAGTVYALEAAGSCIGGAAVTFLLVPYLEGVRIGLLLSGLILGASLVVSLRSGRSRRVSPFLCVLMVIVVGVALSPLAGRLGRWTRRTQLGPGDLDFSRDSAYGHVAVLSREGQYTFLVDGVPTATTPVPDVAAIEEQVHLPALFHPSPDTVLLIGGGIGGGLGELLKHPVRHVDYVELDAALVEAARAVDRGAPAAALGDPRVRVVADDGRRYLAGRVGAYDLVVLSHPPPASLSANRYYTVEFYGLVRRHLRRGGVLAVSCPGSDAFMGTHVLATNAVFAQTLETAFPHVRAIPGERVLFLATGHRELLEVGPEVLSERLETRSIEARLLSADHLGHKLDPGRRAWYEAEVEGASAAVEANRDARPVAVSSVLGHRLALATPDLESAFSALRGASLPGLLAGLLVLFLGLGLLVRTREAPVRAAARLSVGATGFSAMSLGVVLLFAFQTLYGTLYGQIGVFTGSAALGMALGSAAGRRLAPGVSAARSMVVVEAAAILVALAVPVCLTGPGVVAHTPGYAILLVLNALVGGLVGFQFPLAARVCTTDPERVAGPAGRLYAADLAGACAGAALVSVALVPTVGLPATCVVVAATKACSLAILALNAEPRPMGGRGPED